MISPEGSMFQFSPNPDFPQYIRPVVRLDLAAAPFTGTVLPAAKSCPDPMMMSELFIGYPAEDCRTLKMNHEGHRHDNFNTFHVLWKPFIEDGDGKRYRVAASFSEAYDFPEKFQLFLIPESYDLTGPCMEHDIENHWLCPNWMMDGQYGQGRTVEIVVNPEEGTVLWRKDRKLYRWESPFVHFSEEQLMDDLPEDFTLKALDEKKQCRIRPDDVCLFDFRHGRYVIEKDGEEYFGIPDLMRSDDPDCVSLDFDEDIELENLFLPPGIRVLAQWPCSRCRVYTKRLLLPEELESVEEAALGALSGLTRMNLPESLTNLEPQYGLTDLREVIIEGDLSRMENWCRDAFPESPCAEAYRALWTWISSGDIPETADGRYCLRVDE